MPGRPLNMGMVDDRQRKAIFASMHERLLSRAGGAVRSVGRGIKRVWDRTPTSIKIGAGLVAGGYALNKLGVRGAISAQLKFGDRISAQQIHSAAVATSAHYKNVVYDIPRPSAEGFAHDRALGVRGLMREGVDARAMPLYSQRTKQIFGSRAPQFAETIQKYSAARQANPGTLAVVRATHASFAQGPIIAHELGHLRRGRGSNPFTQGAVWSHYRNVIPGGNLLEEARANIAGAKLYTKAGGKLSHYAAVTAPAYATYVGTAAAKSGKFLVGAGLIASSIRRRRRTAYRGTRSYQ